MPKYFPFKICGYYLYLTAHCVVECMHVHAMTYNKLRKFNSKR